jgi:adenylate cyclase
VAEPLPVYELEGTGTLRTRLDLSRARGFSRFVGRSDELGALDAALQRAIEGKGGVVGVVADAGVGKSRLCLEFSERCRAREIPVFSAHCPAHGRLVPLLPVYELVRDFFGIAENDSAQTTREKIAGRMLLLDRELDAQLPLAFDFLGVPDPARPLETTDPQQKQRDLDLLLRRLVRARSAREPAVMLMDDVHWIDSGSDEYLASIAATVAGTRTLLLLNFRPEYGAPWMKDSSYQQLPLLPLGDEAIEELLGHLLGDHPSTLPLRPFIRERTAGNPFFVEEVVQSLVEAGSLRGERGSYELEGRVDRLRVPSSVQAILAARIDRLGSREKALLQTAAAIGRRFADPLLRRVCELPADEYDEALAALRRAELVHEEALYPEVEYAFRHPLTHEVAQGSQLSERRRAVHAKIAASLEELRAERLDEHAALLAHHWDEAAEAPPAARWHRRAAEHIAGSNSREAKRHWERVRELAEQLDDEAVALELGERSRVMILEYGWRLGVSRSEANELLEEGEAWAKARDDDRALAALYNAFSVPCAFSLGEVPRARDMAREGLRLAEKAGDEVLAFALELRIYFSVEPLGVVADSLEAIEAANRRPVEVMDAASPLVGYDARATAVGFRAWPYLSAGRLSEALAAVQRGIAIARERGASETAGWLLGLEASIRVALGESGLAVGREAYEIGEQIDSDLSRVFAASNLAAAMRAEGDLAGAAALLERVLPLAADSCKHFEPQVLGELSAARRGLGELAAARDAAERALALALERHLGRGEILARVALAGVAIEEGGPERLREARAALEGAEAQAREIGQISELPGIHELRARLAGDEGDASAREAALREAMALYERMGAPRQAERVARLVAG